MLKFDEFMVWLLKQKNTRKFKFVDNENCVFASFLKEVKCLENPWVRIDDFYPNKNNQTKATVTPFPEWASRVTRLMSSCGFVTAAQVKRAVIKYFVDKFAAIPNNSWIVGDLLEEGKCCAMGHLGCRDYGNAPDEAKALGELFSVIWAQEEHGQKWGIITAINDFPRATFVKTDGMSTLGKTPKARILNALKRVERRIAKK